MGKLVQMGLVMVSIRMIKDAPDWRFKVGALFLILFLIFRELSPYIKRWWLNLTGQTPKRPPRRIAANNADSEATRVARVHNDTSLTRKTLTFQPGPLGCGVTRDGVVDRVLEGGQAALAGVEVGWHVMEVGGEMPPKVSDTQSLLGKYRGGFEPYTATFLADKDVVEANSKALDQCREMEEQAKQAEVDARSKGGDAADEQEGPRRRKANDREDREEASSS